MTSVVDKYVLMPQERYNRLSHPTQQLHTDHQTFTPSNDQGLKKQEEPSNTDSHQQIPSKGSDKTQQHQQQPPPGIPAKKDSKDSKMLY